MSKKYVPSFLKTPDLLEPISTLLSPPFPDVFPMNNKNKKTTGSDFPSDAFPMNRKKTLEGNFDAFNKVKKIQENDSFSMNKKKTFDDMESEFEVFGKKKKKDDFPMSKRSYENVNTMNIIPAATFVPGTLASLTANSAINGPTTNQEDSKSFAAKFAHRMRVIEDPDYVPPPVTINVTSEEEFPTLGVMAKTETKSAWGSSSFVTHAEEWQDILEKEREEKETIKKRQELARLKRKAARENANSTKITGPLIIPKKMEKEEEEVFNPIEYDEDTLDENDALYQTEFDEEEWFNEDDEDEEDEDELNPSVYEDRKHRDELY